MKILICKPNASRQVLGQQAAVFQKMVDAQVDMVFLKEGPEWTETYYVDGIIAREMFQNGKEAQEQGYDAYISGSVTDPLPGRIKGALGNTSLGPR